MVEGPLVQVVCTPFTVVAEERLLFYKARQLIAQVLSSAGVVIQKQAPSPPTLARSTNGVPCRLPASTQSSREHMAENVNSVDVGLSARLETIALPVSLLKAWLRKAEAWEESKGADMGECPDVNATWLQTGGESCIVVQPALEYISLADEPVHAISWLQWEEIKAIHDTEQPSHKTHLEPSLGVSGTLSTMYTSPYIVIQVVFLFFYEEQWHRLSPAHLPNAATNARSAPTARSLWPPRVTSTRSSSIPSSASLFTCYLTLEYPPGSQWPHRVPVPIAEPLVTRQELIELVRTTANIHRHHPLRVAYRVWPQAKLSTAPAMPWHDSHADAPSTAAPTVIAAPTTRAPPLRALESSTSMAELIRDILAFGSMAVRLVAVRSSRVPLKYHDSGQYKEDNVGVLRSSQRPCYAEPDISEAQATSTAPATNQASGDEAARGSAQEDNGARRMSSPPVPRAATAGAHPLSAATAEEKNDLNTLEPLPIDREDAEVGNGGTDTFISNAGRGVTREKSIITPPTKDEEVVGMNNCLGNTRENGTQPIIQDSTSPPSPPEFTGNSVLDGEAAEQASSHIHPSDAGKRGETWSSTGRHTQYVPKKGATRNGDSQQQQNPHIQENVDSLALAGGARGEQTTGTRKEPSAQYPGQSSSDTVKSYDQATHPLHECASTAQQRTTTSSCDSATRADPANMVFVRYEVDPTFVSVSGPVLPTVLRHLQEVIFHRCCAHLCQDLDAPRPRFHALHHHCHLNGPSPTVGAADPLGGCNIEYTRPPTSVPLPEYILPLYQYTFTRVEEDALERCIAEVMAVYQGLDQLPEKETEKWHRTTPSPAPPLSAEEPAM